MLATVRKVGAIFRSKHILNLVLSGFCFQLTWFACVLLPNPYWLIAVACYFLVYFTKFSGAKYAGFIALAGITGIVMDYALFRLGFFAFSPAQFPFWLIALWFVFVSSIPVAFPFLLRYLSLASIVGAFGGSSAYVSATLLRDDVSFQLSVLLSAAILFWVWALLLPALCLLCRSMGRGASA